MNIRAKILFGMIIVLSFTLIVYHINQCKCNIKEKINITRSCIILGESSYNVLNNFCDDQQGWYEISVLLRKDPYFKTSSGKILPSSYWGVDKSLCGDESQINDLNDSEVVLCIMKDTSLIKYDGALNKLFFKYEKSFDYKFKNAEIILEKELEILDLNNINVNYLFDNKKVDLELLNKLRGSVYLDSAYSKKYSTVDYRVLNRNSRICLASIKYTDYGKRFYFNVYNIEEEK